MISMIENCAESDYKDLATELKILIHIGEHMNIVNLLGSCTLKGELLVILEYCVNGSLLSFLKSRRDTFVEQWIPIKNGDALNLHDLASISFQIANGMSFLECKKVRNYIAMLTLLFSVFLQRWKKSDISGKNISYM